MTALIFDTETHKLHGDLIEAAGIGCQFIETGGHLELIRTQKEFSQRYKPSEPIGLGAMAVHHILDSDVQNCKPYTAFQFPEDMIPTYIIGHNIDYDIETIQRASMPTFFLRPICTLAMARYVWPNLEAHNLAALAYHVSSNRKATRRSLRNSHSALNDCKTTFSLLYRIVKDQNIQSFEELYQFSEQARIPTHIFWGKYKGRSIASLDEWDIEWILKRTDDNYLASALHYQLSKLTQDSSLSFDDDLL
ncbi:3'-5' exonuclease [Acinetobacter qingfengensis]|uniref:DNA polymerase III subunit epsilon n=1 Tax=Acinetobacter qingfengensis TaxID=1262585 RepID=A0A1E7RC27_9GAMM|nr:3'-5' exonuclease [Acinetobacter qingfengensis]KAA8734880.1 3'-5' exonuclease [Acinetobacter qingfengensis]OEY96950.1 DNA polymerase III subunit epsilon [Acinetobacter qingfengensis]